MTLNGLNRKKPSTLANTQSWEGLTPTHDHSLDDQAHLHLNITPSHPLQNQLTINININHHSHKKRKTKCKLTLVQSLYISLIQTLCKINPLCEPRFPQKGHHAQPKTPHPSMPQMLFQTSAIPPWDNIYNILQVCRQLIECFEHYFEGNGHE